MKILPRKILIFTSFSLGALTLIIWIALFRPRPQDLSKAICQPGDLGERYVRSTRFPVSARLDSGLDEKLIESYTVELVDLSLTYTELKCSILRYTDEASAHRAFQKVCENRSKSVQPPVGDETCDSPGDAPRSLAFRHGEYLVLMSGDVFVFPARAVDERLH